MSDKLKKRIKAFFWGMGGFMAVAVSAYITNIEDIREIEPDRLMAIVVVSALGYIVNQITKTLNK